MEIKLLVTLNTPNDAQTVKDMGCRIIAEYPDSLLAECTENQAEALKRSGIEANWIEPRLVRSAGNAFNFGSALEADSAAPLDLDPSKTAYYLVKLAGPASPDLV